MKIYRIAANVNTHKHLLESLTSSEREEIKSRFGNDLKCSFKKDKDGYYCCTHRARSKSYPSIDTIPKSEVKFIGSTG